MTICRNTSSLTKSLIWAAVMLLIAGGAIIGLLPEKMAGTLIVIVPALAVISIYGRGCRKVAA